MFTAARPALRSPALRRVAFRRFESTTTQKAAEAAKDTAGKAKEYQAKASEGLSRVTSSAGPAIAGFAKGVTGTLGKIGGRTGKLIAFIESTSTSLENSAVLSKSHMGNTREYEADISAQNKPLSLSTTPRLPLRWARSSLRARR